MLLKILRLVYYILILTFQKKKKHTQIEWFKAKWIYPIDWFHLYSIELMWLCR